MSVTSFAALQQRVPGPKPISGIEAELNQK